MEGKNNEETPMEHPEDADEQDVIEEGDLAETLEEMELADVEAEGLEGEEGEEEELPDDSIQGFFAHKGTLQQHHRNRRLRFFPSDVISHQSLAMLIDAVEPVYTVSLCSAIPGLAVSGGGDDQAYLWQTDSGETKAQLTGACTTTCHYYYHHLALIQCACASGQRRMG
jgi:hypothetical protein